MFGAAIIVFRESLEAALLVGIVAAATRGLDKRNLWLALGIGAGLAGALAVAGLTEKIGQLADGSGQELLNAAILGIAVLMLGWHNVWMASHSKEMAIKAQQVGAAVKNGSSELSAVAIVVALAVLREGSETVLFLYGMASNSSSSQLLAGGGLGLAAGVALGIVIYHGLLRIPLRWFFSVTSTLLLLLAAGLAGQMARFLIQGDLLPPLASPLWDSSRLLPVDSALGTALHVLIGYESQPSAMQVLFYFVTFACIVAGTAWVRQQQTGNPKLGRR